jgi:hypothetical protein
VKENPRNFYNCEKHGRKSLASHCDFLASLVKVIDPQRMGGYVDHRMSLEVSIKSRSFRI